MGQFLIAAFVLLNISFFSYPRLLAGEDFKETISTIASQVGCRIVELDCLDHPNNQRRILRVLLPLPSSDAEVSISLRELYRASLSDMKKSSPSATSNFLSILLYETEEEATDYDGYNIASVIVGGKQSEWNESLITWNKKRDRQGRPSVSDRELYSDYSRQLSTAFKRLDWFHREEDGSFSTDANVIAKLEQEKADEESRIVADLIRKHALTRDEFSLRIARVWTWKAGSNVTPEAIESARESLIEDWNPQVAGHDFPSISIRETEAQDLSEEKMKTWLPLSAFEGDVDFSRLSPRSVWSNDKSTGIVRVSGSATVQTPKRFSVIKYSAICQYDASGSTLLNMAVEGVPIFNGDRFDLDFRDWLALKSERTLRK